MGEHHKVLFIDLVARVSEPLGCFSGIGHQEESLAVHVESPDVVEVMEMRGDEIVDRRPFSRVRAGAQVTGRFIQKDCCLGFGGDPIPVDVDCVFGANARAEIRADFAVEKDAAASYNFLTAAARSNSAGCQVTVQAWVLFTHASRGGNSSGRIL